MSHRLQVERALTHYYFGTDSGNGAGPVRSLDASRATLAKALGALAGEDAVTALAQACDGPSETAHVLAVGWRGQWPDSQSPGYLRYLVLTCAVVSLADEAKSHEFGLNLAALWGCENIFRDRSGLPGLWRQLAVWCRSRSAQGSPIREFVLPKDELTATGRPRFASARHLRFTYEVAFPTWRDLSHLRVVLSRRHELASRCRDPFDAARLLCPVIEQDQGFSEPMRLASMEFTRLFEARATLLGLHRFWGAISHVLQSVEPPASTLPQASLILRLGYEIEDAEARVHVRPVRRGISSGAGSETLEGPAPVVIRTASHWLREQGPTFGQSLLFQSLESGAVLLFESSFAQWESADDVERQASACILLLNVSQRRDLSGVGRKLGQLSDQWALFGPLDGLAKAALLSKLGFGRGASGHASLGLRVHGGVRVGATFLGRPGFLPKISASGQGRVRVVRVADGCAADIELVETSEREFAIQSSTAIEGRVAVRLEEALVEGIDPLVFEKQLTFVREATEHDQLRDIDESRWSSVEEISVVPVSDVRSAEGTTCRHDRAPMPTGRCMQDLAEVLYAKGAAGWSEADLAAALSKVISSDGPSVWDVLRSLQEVRWLEPTIAVTWRVRRWWLRCPELALVQARHGPHAVLLGSVPGVLLRRFGATVVEAKGRVAPMMAPSDYCLTPYVAEGVGAKELLDELRWNVAALPGRATLQAPACWPPTHQEPSRHEPVAVWSMASGCFQPAGGVSRTAGGLTRYRRPAGDRADLYTVFDGVGVQPWVSASRTAAVVEAYRLARRPMFAVRGEWLVRLPNDGYLPAPLAEAAMLRTGRVPGPYKDGRRWTYAYPVDAVLLQDLRTLFAEDFVDGPVPHGGERRRSYLSTVSMARGRARGSLRALGSRLR